MFPLKRASPAIIALTMSSMMISFFTLVDNRQLFYGGDIILQAKKRTGGLHYHPPFHYRSPLGYRSFRERQYKRRNLRRRLPSRRRQHGRAENIYIEMPEIPNVVLGKRPTAAVSDPGFSTHVNNAEPFQPHVEQPQPIQLSNYNQNPGVQQASNYNQNTVVQQPSNYNQNPSVQQPSNYNQNTGMQQPSNYNQHPSVQQPSNYDQNTVVQQPSNSNQNLGVQQPSNSDQNPGLQQPSNPNQNREYQRPCNSNPSFRAYYEAPCDYQRTPYGSAQATEQFDEPPPVSPQYQQPDPIRLNSDTQSRFPPDRKEPPALPNHVPQFKPYIEQSQQAYNVQPQQAYNVQPQQAYSVQPQQAYNVQPQQAYNVQPVQQQPYNMQPDQQQPYNVQPVQQQPYIVQPVQQHQYASSYEEPYYDSYSGSPGTRQVQEYSSRVETYSSP